MAILNKVINLDEYFNSIEEKTLINALPYHRKVDRDKIIEELQTINDSDNLSSVAKCRCGALKGNYKLQTKETCRQCGTPAYKVRGAGFDPTLWCFRLTDTRFINPKLWMLINAQFSTSMDSMLYLCDPSYKPTVKLKRPIEDLVQQPEFERSYAFVVRNLEQILTFFAEEAKPKTFREPFRVLLEMYRDAGDDIFSDHLPIIGKRLFIKEENKKTTLKAYVQKASASNFDNALRFMKTASLVPEDDIEQREVIMAKTISTAANATSKYYTDALQGKFGGSRKLINAAKSFLGGRAVGTSITHAHNMEQIYIPWSVAIVIFRGHLINKLVKLGWSLKHINAHLLKHYSNHDPLLKKLFAEIIAEYPDPDGFATVVLRNPTLTQSSMLYLKIAGVKDDPIDTTVSLSVLLMTFLAGDFDGDEYTFQLLPDKILREAFRSLEPASSVFSYDTPGEVAGVITITKASSAILASMIHNCEKENVELNNIFEF